MVTIAGAGQSRSRYPGLIVFAAQFRAADAIRPASRSVSSSAEVGIKVLESSAGGVATIPTSERGLLTPGE